MKGHRQVYDGQRRKKPDTGAHAEAVRERESQSDVFLYLLIVPFYDPITRVCIKLTSYGEELWEGPGEGGGEEAAPK